MGGMPKGFTVLVYGIPGSGTDLLAKQFATAGVGLEEVVYFSTSERAEDIFSTIGHFGWNKEIRIVDMAEEHYEHVLSKELDICRYRKEGIKLKDVKKGQKYRKVDTNMLTSLIYEVSKLKTPFRFVMNSLDFFFEYYDHGRTLSAIRTIKAHTQKSDSLALFTLFKGVYDERLQSGVEEIADCIVELELERGEQEFKRSLVIRKLRNLPERTGVFPCEISKSGIGNKTG
ncbi:MAG: recombinase RecA [Thermoplasmata archaeon]|nr:recombinase RecA [Thermoplasmata archaeon]